MELTTNEGVAKLAFLIILGNIYIINLALSFYFQTETFWSLLFELLYFCKYGTIDEVAFKAKAELSIGIFLCLKLFLNIVPLDKRFHQLVTKFLLRLIWLIILFLCFKFQMSEIYTFHYACPK